MYIGEITHKGQSYPGEHPPIVEQETFNAVQARFAANAAELTRTRMASEALLLGRLYDDAGNRMSPMHAQKRGARYRYYVSAPLRHGGDRAVGTVPRVSAPDIETAVVAGLTQVWKTRSPDADTLVPDDRALVAELLGRVVLKRGFIELSLARVEGDTPCPENGDISLLFSVRRKKPRRDQIASTADVDGPPPKMRSNKRRRLVLAIAKARLWVDELVSGRITSTKVIAQREGISERYVRMILPLAFFAPGVVQMAIRCSLSANVGTSKIADRLALSWNEQTLRCARARIGT